MSIELITDIILGILAGIRVFAAGFMLIGIVMFNDYIKYNLNLKGFRKYFMYVILAFGACLLIRPRDLFLKLESPIGTVIEVISIILSVFTLFRLFAGRTYKDKGDKE